MLVCLISVELCLVSLIDLLRELLSIRSTRSLFGELPADFLPFP